MTWGTGRFLLSSIAFLSMYPSADSVSPVYTSSMSLHQHKPRPHLSQTDGAPFCLSTSHSSSRHASTPSIRSWSLTHQLPPTHQLTHPSSTLSSLPGVCSSNATITFHPLAW